MAFFTSHLKRPDKQTAFSDKFEIQSYFQKIIATLNEYYHRPAERQIV